MLTTGYSEFTLRDVRLQSGQTLPEIKLAYRLYGKLNRRRDNLVVFPTYFTGRHDSNDPYFGAGRALDPARHCILVPCLIGNGESSSPSTLEGPRGGAAFPHVSLHDNVRLQHALIEAVCPVERIALVIGWSMGGMQTYEWVTQFPDLVEAALPFCATARCSPHNFVFLEGVKAALMADQAWQDGQYSAPPRKGLRAFGRAYAGWAYSGAFFDDGLYRDLGFTDLEALLRDWEDDHLSWDANDLLHKIRTWQQADVSANDRYKGDFSAALGAVTARMIVMPSSSDMYFSARQSEQEAAKIRNADFRPFVSDLGHCACTPSRPDPRFMAFLDKAIIELLAPN